MSGAKCLLTAPTGLMQVQSPSLLSIAAYGEIFEHMGVLSCLRTDYSLRPQTEQIIRVWLRVQDVNNFPKRQVCRVVIVPLIAGIFAGGVLTYDRNWVWKCKKFAVRGKEAIPWWQERSKSCNPAGQQNCRHYICKLWPHDCVYRTKNQWLRSWYSWLARRRTW